MGGVGAGDLGGDEYSRDAAVDGVQRQSSDQQRPEEPGVHQSILVREDRSREAGMKCEVKFPAPTRDRGAVAARVERMRVRCAPTVAARALCPLPEG